jgi:hypothetical protein
LFHLSRKPHLLKLNLLKKLFILLFEDLFIYIFFMYACLHLPASRRMAVFADGRPATQTTAATVATVGVFSEENFELKTQPRKYAHPVTHHGFVQARHDYFLTTERRDLNETVLSRIGLYQWKTNAYERVKEMEITCPRAHGHYQNDHFILMGCEDGVLSVKNEAVGQFIASKIATKRADNTNVRISQIRGSSGDIFVAGASGNMLLYSINALNGTSKPINWTTQADLIASRYDFANDDKAFVIVDRKGFITVLSPNNDEWKILKNFKFVTGDALPPIVTGQPTVNYELTVSGSAPEVFVYDPVAKEIKVISLIETDIKVTSTIKPSFEPALIQWLGIQADDGRGQHGNRNDNGSGKDNSAVGGLAVGAATLVLTILTAAYKFALLY